MYWPTDKSDILRLYSIIADAAFLEALFCYVHVYKIIADKTRISDCGFAL